MFLLWFLVFSFIIRKRKNIHISFQIFNILTRELCMPLLSDEVKLLCVQFGTEYIFISYCQRLYLVSCYKRHVELCIFNLCTLHGSEWCSFQFRKSWLHTKFQVVEAELSVHPRQILRHVLWCSQYLWRANNKVNVSCSCYVMQ